MVAFSGGIEKTVAAGTYANADTASEIAQEITDYYNPGFGLDIGTSSEGCHHLEGGATRPAVLIIDELGYLPMPTEDANALFQVISQRYLKSSIILTTNRGANAWGDIFGDTTIAAAMLDRLLHRCAVINITGDSYRLRAHQATNRQRTTTFQPPQGEEFR